MEPGEIKRLRKRLKLTQRGLAKVLDLDSATVGRWECGLRRPSGPARAALRLLAQLRALQSQGGPTARPQRASKGQGAAQARRRRPGKSA